jgi:hypothetical protein
VKAAQWSGNTFPARWFTKGRQKRQKNMRREPDTSAPRRDQPRAARQDHHERAVFEVAAEDLVLTELADGVDIRKDILDQMEFAPARMLDRPKPMHQALSAH